MEYWQISLMYDTVWNKYLSIYSCWYLVLKFALMFSILVLTLNIMDVSILLSLFMWGLRFPVCHWVFSNRYCVFFPSSFWSMVSWNLLIISFDAGVCVSFFVSVLLMVFVVSFRPPFVLLLITIVVILLGLFSMFILFLVVIVVISSSPDSCI